MSKKSCRKGPTAIRLENASAKFVNAGFRNFDTGIEAVNSKIDATGLTFDNVTTPLRSENSQGSICQANIINDPKLSNSKRSRNTTLGWRKAKGAPLPVYCLTVKMFTYRTTTFFRVSGGSRLAILKRAKTVVPTALK